MKYVTDDGKNTFCTAEECLAFEEAQKIDGEIKQQIGEYLDSVTLADKDGKERNLTGREFSRRATVIQDWIRWDRQQRPERYESAEVDEQAVAVIQGRA